MSGSSSLSIFGDLILEQGACAFSTVAARARWNRRPCREARNRLVEVAMLGFERGEPCLQSFCIEIHNRHHSTLDARDTTGPRHPLPPAGLRKGSVFWLGALDRAAHVSALAPLEHPLYRPRANLFDRVSHRCARGTLYAPFRWKGRHHHRRSERHRQGDRAALCRRGRHSGHRRSQSRRRRRHGAGNQVEGRRTLWQSA